MSRDPKTELETVDTLDSKNSDFNALAGSFTFQNMSQHGAVENDFVMVESSSKINFKGQMLARYKPKTAGKNKDSQFDGFYKDGNGVSFFVKKPKDPGELFAELLAGKIIEGLKQRQLIPTAYHRSLIVADCVQLPDAGYALIQPAVKFQELFKIIGTGKASNSDRSVPFELIKGIDLYRLPFVNGNRYFGLSWTVMIALLLGDYSLHSANIVALDGSETTDSQQFGKIDWGAAFRDFVNPENHEDILLPKEYRGTFNFKLLTKGYVAYYRNIPGFFSIVQERANEFFLYVNKEGSEVAIKAVFQEIVEACFTEIPEWILKQLTEKEMKYFGFNEADRQCFGKDRNDFFKTVFIPRFRDIFAQRLAKLAALDRMSATFQSYDLYPVDSQEGVYQSTLSSSRLFSTSTPGSNCSCCDYQTIYYNIMQIINDFGQRVATPPMEVASLGCPVERQLRIIVPENRISLELKASALSDYLREEMSKKNKGKRLLAIPIHLGEHRWGSLMIYIGNTNSIASVCFMGCQSLSSEGVLTQLFCHLKAIYPNFEGTIKHYASKNEMSSAATADVLATQVGDMVMRAYFGCRYNQIEHREAYQYANIDALSRK